MSGRAEWLPWRRDWSKHPDAWRSYAVLTVAWVALGAVYFGRGESVGFGYLGLAIASGLLARYTFRKARSGPVRRPD